MRAIIHGGAGAIGSAVARVFAREGASLFLSGRTSGKLDALLAELRQAGATAEGATLDVLDVAAVDAHADAVARRAGGIDILVNAVGVDHVQGVPFAQLALHDFMYPIDFYLRASFVAAQAAARHMAAQKRGVVIGFSPPGSRLAGRGYIGSGAAFAGVEAFSRLLAAELGPSGVRVVCLQPHAIPEALEQGSHTRQVFARVAEAAGTTVDALFEERMKPGTLLGRLPTLANVAETAAFVASQGGQAMTGAIVNLTCGTLVD